MQLIILAVLASVAIAAPQYEAAAPSPSRYSDDDSKEHVPILRDDRVHEDDGSYSLAVETGDGITLTESGSPSGPEGAVESSGQYSYTAPDGTKVSLSYVADENGFQPQSDLLPVAPEFPHEIPQFVLDQIAFAAEEDAARAREEARAPSRSYGAPQ